ncbi:hypothetical protein BDP27DRAFT_1248071 [Rhodocollybia butyracea]|uniref:Uncharacterized protein n=1 Tax=Rhodocollybia butyracea TaxID=206335 RepID=A0A9P5P1H8_9AGAR|nr:hypothetical protein BDP27DRAFT_1248071 [Rhodocollybia butyracea]
MGIDSGQEGEEEEWLGISGKRGEEREDWDYEHLVREIEGEDEKEFNADAVEAPKHTNPFDNDQTYCVFKAALARLDESGQIPLGYGVHPLEWDEDGYPALGSIHCGQKGSKMLEVALPDSVWRPRSV